VSRVHEGRVRGVSGAGPEHQTLDELRGKLDAFYLLRIEGIGNFTKAGTDALHEPAPVVGGNVGSSAGAYDHMIVAKYNSLGRRRGNLIDNSPISTNVPIYIGTLVVLRFTRGWQKEQQRERTDA